MLRIGLFLLIAATLYQARCQANDTCAYTFIVPSDSASEVWPTGVTQGRMQSAEDNIDNHASLINYQQSQLQVVFERLATLENVPGATGAPVVGSTYVRWGRTVCPNTAELVYKGYTGKAYHTHGGGVNYQCLPEDPEWPEGADTTFQTSGRMYGVEYQANSPVWPSGAFDHDVPCAVCKVSGRSQLLMIPAKKTCPSGWVAEYEGLLVSSHIGHKGSTFECLDNDMEYDTAGSANQDGGLFYTVQGTCGSLPCPPYENGKELACVVCTFSGETNDDDQLVHTDE